MKKIIIFGNSSSGKSTLAKHFVKVQNLAHLDLDTVSWEKDDPIKRRSLSASLKDIRGFMEKNSQWVIEGCYADLLRELKDLLTKRILPTCQ